MKKLNDRRKFLNFIASTWLLFPIRSRAFFNIGLIKKKNSTPRQFNISPSHMGKSVWNLESDGALNLSSFGTWTITPQATFTAPMKMWGAGGGSGNQSDSLGGPGGFASGNLSFENGIAYQIVIGEKGGYEVSTAGVGGGAGATNSAGAGGGYTGVFRVSVSQANSRIMAGGGAGSGAGPNDRGGAGGGSVGAIGVGGDPAGGGTQVAGGAAGGNNGGVAGSALTGGHPGQRGGGGGGGYYGGGSNRSSSGNSARAGGGGGSGYTHGTISSSVLTQGTTGGLPGNSGDSNRGSSGQGGTGSSTDGTDGRFYMS